MRLKKISLFSVLVVWMLGAAACSSTPDVPHAPDPGDSDFISAAPGGGGAYGAAEDSSTEGGRNEAPAAQETTPEREIEEADIVKLDGNLLYALNSYRGLYIIDMADPDDPEILGHQDMFGYPVEMYVRDGRAYVVLSNYFRMWLTADGDADPEVGSNVTVVDVLEPSAPFVLSRFHMPGYVTDTRIVGDVLYTVSNRYWWFWYYGGHDNEDTTTVMSLNIADPATIHLVDDYTFDRCEGWDNHIHVTTEAIYVASSCWDYDGYSTQVRYVDISNPAGQMALGAQFEFEGVVRDRWALSEHDGVLRVVAADTWWSTDNPRIHTYNVTSPTQIQPLATLELQLPRPESVTATRFDGERAYVVTYERIDPLYTVDLSDPTTPVQSGELEMPGWLDHIVPRGNRLVALGHDEVNGETRLAVSLFDVTQLSQPTLLSRVHFGEGWGWLTDERDNFDKVFKVLDGPGLILVPFMQWVENSQTGWWRYKGGVQLIDFTNDALTLRGHAQHDGYIRRALVHNHRLVTLSDQRLQVMDIGDRDNPTPTADLALSRNVTQFAVMGNYAVQLVGDWYRGNTSVVVLPLSDPDLGEPIAELAIEAPYARLFSNDDHLFVLYRDVEDYSIKLQSVDLSDPSNPQLAGLLTLPETFDTYGYYYGWWWWGSWWYPPLRQRHPGQRLHPGLPRLAVLVVLVWMLRRRRSRPAPRRGSVVARHPGAGLSAEPHQPPLCRKLHVRRRQGGLHPLPARQLPWSQRAPVGALLHEPSGCFRPLRPPALEPGERPWGGAGHPPRRRPHRHRGLPVARRQHHASKRQHLSPLREPRRPPRTCHPPRGCRSRGHRRRKRAFCHQPLVV